MTALPRRRKSVRRAEILAAAREVFVAKAFEQASVAEIAARADCVEGTIYTYFRNKRDLFEAVLTDVYDALIADIEPRFAAIDGTADRLRFLVARHLQIAVDDPGLSGMLGREARSGEPYYGSKLHALNRRYVRYLTRTLADGVERGELRADLDLAMARDVVFGGLEHRVRDLLGRGRRIEPARMAREIAALLLDGFAARPAAAVAPAPVADPIDRLEARLARLEDELRARARRTRRHDTTPEET
ncbi:MAG TPA: TetR/AcrR family transcriptional regulator [Burkholderiaceae bacterium]|nr:TetR/AcrR family transcriptional regulator [Burkholderiaceae bacterium]